MTDRGQRRNPYQYVIAGHCSRCMRKMLHRIWEKPGTAICKGCRKHIKGAAK